jgi:hypothetical protein
MDLPKYLQDAIEIGILTKEQLLELATIEATELGLTLEEAANLKKERNLPHNTIGNDIDFLLDLVY